MEKDRRIKTERQRLYRQAIERWRAYQPEGAGRSHKPHGQVPTPQSSVGTVSVEQRAKFETRDSLRARFDSTEYRALRRAAERQIGATLDFADLPPNEQAMKAGQAVARIVNLPRPGLVTQGYATGFLVAPTLLLTNHHVFRTPSEAQGAAAQFCFERVRDGLSEGQIFECDPGLFFLNNVEMDYALVALRPKSLQGAPLAQFKFVPLIAATGKIKKGDPVNIIQYPAGGPKQYATVNNRLLDLREDGFLLYETDTLEGSSGAPVFNEHWEAIGLHHCGVPQIEGGQLVTRDGRRVALDAEVSDGDLVWIANEGIRVSALVDSLRRQHLGSPDQRALLASLLVATADPLRLVEAARPVYTPAPEGSMAQNVFNFSGPVTIYVGASEEDRVAVIARGGAQMTAAPAGPDFREKTLAFDEDYAGRDRLGYNPAFLDNWEVPHPTVSHDYDGTVLKVEGKVWVIPYYHYSLVMNVPRRLVAWAASNVDYSDAAREFTMSRKDYGGENWRLDPRVAISSPGLQLQDADFYAPAKRIDRGHVVRREDGAWGATAEEAEYGNSDTYHWTNCTPQSEAFNQSGKNGIWGQFESHIQREVGAVGGRMSVFAGPVLSTQDPKHGYEGGPEVQVPMAFWKVVICAATENQQRVRLAYGFIFDQSDAIARLGYERMDMDSYEINQVPLSKISSLTGIDFDQGVLNADVMSVQVGTESLRRGKGRSITRIEDVLLR